MTIAAAAPALCAWEAETFVRMGEGICEEGTFPCGNVNWKVSSQQWCKQDQNLEPRHIVLSRPRPRLRPTIPSVSRQE